MGGCRNGGLDVLGTDRDLDAGNLSLTDVAAPLLCVPTALLLQLLLRQLVLKHSKDLQGPAWKWLKRFILAGSLNSSGFCPPARRVIGEKWEDG